MTITHKEQLTALAVSSEDQGTPKTRRKNPNWPDLLTRMKWATERTVSMGLTGIESAILKHVCFVDGIGEGCFQNQQTMVAETGWNHSTISRARESHFSTKTLKEHIRYLVDANLINRLRHFSKPTETRLGTVGVETSPTVGVETSPTVGVEITPLTNSSSTNLINQKVPRLVDAKRVDDSGPEDGFIFSSLEEEGTGPRRITKLLLTACSPMVTEFDSETPTPMAKHCRELSRVEI